MNNVKSILLAGVGGQGILRASDILCLALMEAGFDTKKERSARYGPEGRLRYQPRQIWR